MPDRADRPKGSPGLSRRPTIRGRDLGVPFDGEPGLLNAITDVAGVEVGYATLIRGSGPLVVGQGPVRTGVTAILPRGRAGVDQAVFGAMFSLNGNGELTGSHWARETARIEGPITLTNTHSLGVARDATIRWLTRRFDFEGRWALPVAGETYDGWLNDINGFHVTETDVIAALDGARGGLLAEGNVGGGTGMIAFGFKGGSGSASRRVGEHLLGAFVQANFGLREQLVIAGRPVGRMLAHDPPTPWRAGESGSVIAVVATNAPLLPHQLERIARRVTLGIGRTGGQGGHSSGDIFLAFSTANAEALAARDVGRAEFIADERLNPFFEATIQAVEEAVINAMVAAETMEGANGRVVHALPHEALHRAFS